ncbi:MAG: radical SAM family heme chaperone HemW [Polyangiaceae bacterium]|nr:radical SAM family heme chaperone HemW [Polyangiaceae bacterium]
MSIGIPPWPIPPRELGVYVHFPWCLRKCGYCDFLSVALPREAIPVAAYTDAVLAELHARAPHVTMDRAAVGADGTEDPEGTSGNPSPVVRVASVYFGGGTPSLWTPRELGRVIAGVAGAFTVDPNVEITVECNPSSFSREQAESLLAVGANRVSIGVQGLDSGRLAFLERLHDGAQALAAVEAAVAARVPRIAADLIFGLPEQSAAAAASEARILAALPVTHLSAYALTIEPDTPFGDRARTGRLPLVSEELLADSFLAVSDTLVAAGLTHYEVSNYARGGHVSRHNLGCWRGQDYLGLGAGAWGTITDRTGRIRYRNTPSPERYVAGYAALGRSASRDPARWPAPWPGAVTEQEPIDAETALRERLMLGLRLAEGVDLVEAAAALGVAPFPRSRRAAIDRLTAQGRLSVDGGRLVIPRSAWLLADGTIADLI